MNTIKRYMGMAAAAVLIACLALPGWAGDVAVSDHEYDGGRRMIAYAVADNLCNRVFSWADAGQYNATSATQCDLVWNNTVSYSIGNKAYRLANGTLDLSGAGSWTTQMNATSARYLFVADASGNVWAVNGTIVPGTGSPAWPENNASTVPFAGVEVTTTQAANFTLGATGFNATGITAVWHSLSGNPGRVLTR